MPTPGLDTFEECIEQLVDDTAALLPFIDQHLNTQMNLKVVDVGSGAGIPGILLTMMRPNWKVRIPLTSQKLLGIHCFTDSLYRSNKEEMQFYSRSD